jgi:hypothetical protein
MVQQGYILVLPGATGGYTSLLGSWSSYSARNREYLMAIMQSMEALCPNDEPLTMEYIWDGDGDIKNSALTVFRHRDSASVDCGTWKTILVVRCSSARPIHSSFQMMARLSLLLSKSHSGKLRLWHGRCPEPKPTASLRYPRVQVSP